MLASGARGCRIESQWVYFWFPFWFPSDFYEIAAKNGTVGPISGTKKWDQKVGPIVLLIFKYLHFRFTHVISLGGRAHITLAFGARERRASDRFPRWAHSFFTFWFPKKVDARSDILEEIPRLSWPFLHKQTVPHFFLKCGTTHNQPHHWIIVGFSWIIIPGSFPR